jgi:hypothetical protein
MIAAIWTEGSMKSRLREFHPSQYREMFGRLGVPRGLGSAYQSFFWRSEWRSLNDPELTRLCRVFRILFAASLALFGAVVVAAAAQQTTTQP